MLQVAADSWLYPRPFHALTGNPQCAQFSLAQLLITVLQVFGSLHALMSKHQYDSCRTWIFFRCTASLDDGHLTANLQHLTLCVHSTHWCTGVQIIWFHALLCRLFLNCCLHAIRVKLQMHSRSLPLQMGS